MAGRSACWWEGPAGPPRLVVRAYWVDGKKWWEINTAARGIAKTMIQKQEGVALDSVLKTGPISGFGDKAIFSPGGSLVLKGDILLDIMQPYWPNPEAQFRPLVTKMLSRL